MSTQRFRLRLKHENFVFLFRYLYRMTHLLIAFNGLTPTVFIEMTNFSVAFLSRAQTDQVHKKKLELFPKMALQKLKSASFRIYVL